MTRRSNALEDALRATTLDVVRQPDCCDAVVVGAGAAGGIAALLLAEAGLRVLVLDAGWPADRQRSPLRRLTMDLVRRLADPEGLSMLPPLVVPRARAAISAVGRWRQPVQSTSYAWLGDPNAFVDDRDCPYVTPEGLPFTWIRARQLGGRMEIPWHGRQYYRLGLGDLHPQDGLSPAWPLGPEELDSWYALVERRLRLAGSHGRIPWLPDSELSTELSWSDDEAALRDRIASRWPHARAVIARHAPPLQALPAAAQTGRLLCRRGAVANEILVDNNSRVAGVRWFDEESRSQQTTRAPLVFLCASALESTRILMLSRPPNSPAGLGADSGALGRYLMDHTYVKIEGQSPALVERRGDLDVGRCIFLPRFDARLRPEGPAGRGFGVQVSQFSGGWDRTYFVAASFGEMLPLAENRVSIDSVRKDAWGIPALRIECRHSVADLALARAQAEALRELADAAGVTFAQLSRVPGEPGESVHECGTARMGTAPSNSVVDPHNECWDARGLYVTDGASFPSQGYQNPTLTIMALTARACDHGLTAAFGKTLLQETDSGPR